MFAALLVFLAYAAFAFMVITHRLHIADFTTSLIILIVGFFVMVFIMVKLMTRPSKRARQAAARQAAARQTSTHQPAISADSSGSLTLRVAGTTFENSDGEKRQDILRHMKFGDAPWADDPDDLMAEIEETEFEGEKAFAVLVNGYQVGNVPKTQIRSVEKAMQNMATFYISDVRIIGGGQAPDGKPLLYGCELTLDW